MATYIEKWLTSLSGLDEGSLLDLSLTLSFYVL